jgi:hypothetical protein
VLVNAGTNGSTRLHHLLTSASSTPPPPPPPPPQQELSKAHFETDRYQPLSAAFNRRQPLSLIFYGGVRYTCRDYNSDNPLIPYPHGYLNPYPIQVEAAHVKSIPSGALASMEYFPSTETRSPGNAASR